MCATCWRKPDRCTPHNKQCHELSPSMSCCHSVGLGSTATTRKFFFNHTPWVLIMHVMQNTRFRFFLNHTPWVLIIRVLRVSTSCKTHVFVFFLNTPWVFFKKLGRPWRSEHFRPLDGCLLPIACLLCAREFEFLHCFFFSLNRVSEYSYVEQNDNFAVQCWTHFKKTYFRKKNLAVGNYVFFYSPKYKVPDNPGFENTIGCVVCF